MYRIRTKMMASIKIGAAAGAIAAALGMAAMSASAQEGETLVIGAYGGSANKPFEEALQAFAEQNKITIRYVPGASLEKAAKIVATQDNPEYDIVFYDDFAHAMASNAGALAKINPELVLNLAKLDPRSLLPNGDAVSVGFYFTGLMYNSEEFAKRGWEPPSSWQDIYRPEFCNHLGLASITSSFGMHTVVMLADGDLGKVPDALTKLGTLGDCIQTLETSSTALEQKTQIGEYLVGTAVSTRVPGLARQGFPVKFVIPQEGSVLALSVAAVVKNSPREELAQKALNWLLEPESERILMEGNFYVPSNPEVKLTDELLGYGLPSPEQMSNLVTIDYDAVNANRAEWERLQDRAFAN